jgi:hypothetical protein
MIDRRTRGRALLILSSTLHTGTFEMKVVQNFPTITEITPTAVSGAFEIDTGADFTVPNDNYLVGLAKVNHRGQVAPVASVSIPPLPRGRALGARLGRL